MVWGMMGFWITHRKAKTPLIEEEVDRDFVFCSTPPTSTQRTIAMLDFNIWSWNSRVFQHRSIGGPQERQVRIPLRQPDHDEPPDYHMRPRIHRDRHRWRADPAVNRWRE
jgi:hypothetical protein